jgi:hypothetical protein
LQSQFASGWTLSGASNTATDIAPDGTNTFQKLTEDTSTGGHRTYQQVTLAANTTATLSAYVKLASGARYLYVQYNNGDGIYASYNLTTGTVIGTAQLGTGSVTSATITPVGNSVYRITLTGIASTTVANPFVQFYVSNSSSAPTSTSPSYTGDGYSGIYIWGAQLEALAFPTSYIATTSAQVTRASDNASMTGTNFSSWFNIGQGTMYGEAISPNNVINDSTPVGKGIFSLNDGTNANLMVLAYRGNQYLVLNNSATIISSAGIGSLTANTLFKTAAVYATNSNFVQARDGTVGTAVTTGIAPTVNQAWIGRGYASFGIFSGWVKKIAYYPQALTSAQLQALTGS